MALSRFIALQHRVEENSKLRRKKMMKPFSERDHIELRNQLDAIIEVLVEGPSEVTGSGSEKDVMQ